MMSIKWPRVRVPITVLASSLATAILLVGVFLIWVDRVYTEYSTLLRVSPYRVVIPADPGIAGKLYTIGRDSTYLLVLTSRHSRHPEPYHIKLASQEIGVPEFYQYVPLPRSAIIDRCTLDGYPMDTVVAADWEVKNDWREVHIRIRGFLYPLERDVVPVRPDNTIPQMIRLAYQKEIILLRD
jgi:hypothetical protein